MIKNITAGRYLTVTGQPGSTYVSSYNSAHGVGNMRYNTTTQSIEIFDGFNWIQMQSGHATVSMTPEAESLLDWARKKRAEEIERDLLAHTNPTIKDLIKQIEEKEQQILVVQNLLREESKIGTN